MKTIFVCLLLTIATFAEPELKPSAAVSEEQLAAWIVAEVPDWKVAGRLQQNGIVFRPTSEALAEFKAAGASSAVLDAIRQAKTRGKDLQHSPIFSALTFAGGRMLVRDHDGAVKRLAQAIQTDPIDPKLYVAIGRVLTNAEIHREAARAYRRAVELDPNLSEAQLGLAYAYYRLGDGLHAEAAATAALKLDPSDAEAHKNFGLAMEAQGQLEAALRSYEKALRLQPAFPAVYYNMGNVYRQQGDLINAVHAYQQAIRLQPGKGSYYNNLAIAQFDKGDTDAAVKSAETARDLDPTDLPNRQTLLHHYCKSGRYQQAIVEGRAILKINPDWNMARPCLFRSLYKSEDHDGAIRVGQDYLRYEPEDLSMINGLISLYLLKGEKRDAEVMYQRQIAILEREGNDRQLALVLSELGGLYGREREKEARTLFERAISLLNPIPEAAETDLPTVKLRYRSVFNVGQEVTGTTPAPASATAVPSAATSVVESPTRLWMVYFDQAQTGDMNSAEQFLNRALAEAEKIGENSMEMHQTLSRMIMLANSRNDHGQALALARRSLAIQEHRFGPDKLEVAQALEDVARQLEFSDVQELRPLLERSLAIRAKRSALRDSSAVMWMDRLAWIYRDSNEDEKAQALLEQALKLQEEMYGTEAQQLAVPLDHLGAFYRGQGQLAKAEVQFRRALAIEEKTYGPQHRILAGVLSQLTDLMRQMGKAEQANGYQSRREQIEQANRTN